MSLETSPRPAVQLDGSDRDWILAIASAFYEMDRSSAILEYGTILAPKFVNEVEPDLSGEDLEDRLNQEIYERLERARSLSPWEELLSVIRDVDPEMEYNMFGEPADQPGMILASERQIRESSYYALDGLLCYIHTYPERIQANTDSFLNPSETYFDEDQVQQWHEREMEALIIGRRNKMLATLIHDCVNMQERGKRIIRKRGNGAGERNSDGG